MQRMMSMHTETEQRATRFAAWQAALLATSSPTPVLTEAGIVTAVGDGVATVSGLSRALADELLVFASGIHGLVLDLAPDQLGVVLLGPAQRVRLGERVHRSGKVLSVPVGEALLGRVVDTLGRELDNKGPIAASARHPVEAEAAMIIERSPVSRPLLTGIKAVDAAIPVGLGQRQLIIGDRQTGKTALAIDLLLNQRHSSAVCIYCAIGKRGDAVARAIGTLAAGNMLERSIVLNSGDDEAPGLAFVAPYAAMTMAEYFAAQGRDVVLVFDDLTHHARAYRELSLLLRRPPGREAFPGDIFYVHARLLERSGQFSAELGGGSITALPVVETEAENLSAYIPTNLISITDGQIYLSPRLVRRNQFPAIDPGLSVSRVGGKAQHRGLRGIAANLRITLAQFEELEDFARFGTRLDDSVRARLRRGAAVRAALRQPERAPQSVLAQLAVLHAASSGLLDEQPEAGLMAVMDAIAQAAESRLGALARQLAANQPLNDSELAQLLACAADTLVRLHGPGSSSVPSSVSNGANPG